MLQTASQLQGSRDGDGVTISIVLCTYQRSRLLARALEGLARLSVPVGHSAEVVVVDNNSTDDTRAVIAQASTASPIAVRYVSEERQGLAYARNAGIRAARGDIIACTDDDCVVAPDWLHAFARVFAAEPFDVIGGRVELLDPADAAISVRTAAHARQVRTIADIFDLLIGCNLAFRRSVFDAIGGYDERFGRPGGVSADDADFVYRALSAGFVVSYFPDAFVRHGHGRRSPAELAAVRRMYARGRGALYCKHALRADRSIIRHAYWDIVRAIRDQARARMARSSGEESHYLRDLVAGAAYLVMRRQRSGR